MRKYDPEKPLFSLHIPKTAGESFREVLNAWFNKTEFLNINNHPRLYPILVPLNIDLLLQRILSCGLYLHYKNHYYNRLPRKILLNKKYGIFLNKKIRECVHGHFDPQTDGGNLFSFYPNAEQFITVLRDPLEMQISLYNYMKDLKKTYWEGKEMYFNPVNQDIDEWVENRNFYMLNFFPWNINSGNFKEIIERNFIHIGIVENLQRSVDIIAGKLGVKKALVSHLKTSSSRERPSDHSVRKFRQNNALSYEIYEYATKMNE